ncbi:MAG: hypothetical protein MRY74_04955 [Neomegalonema sp.]|nr:hypothetical protein [Neomegalonema sp.]
MTSDSKDGFGNEIYEKSLEALALAYRKFSLHYSWHVYKELGGNPINARSADCFATDRASHLNQLSSIRSFDNLLTLWLWSKNCKRTQIEDTLTIRKFADRLHEDEVCIHRPDFEPDAELTEEDRSRVENTKKYYMKAERFLEACEVFGLVSKSRQGGGAYQFAATDRLHQLCEYLLVAQSDLKKYYMTKILRDRGGDDGE